jgi:hypothetical protein
MHQFTRRDHPCQCIGCPGFQYRVHRMHVPMTFHHAPILFLTQRRYEKNTSGIGIRFRRVTGEVMSKSVTIKIPGEGFFPALIWHGRAR